ncbi:hypothetical protein GTU99_07300 [Streptomyces sp. PRKS01-65]|nr:hypothetical protein [Streptomyces harenosi]
MLGPGGVRRQQRRGRPRRTCQPDAEAAQRRGYLVHSKYLLVEGNYAGHPDTKWTFTGSHNLDYSSLRDNDEALLRVEGATTHDAYARNFAALLAQAAG